MKNITEVQIKSPDASRTTPVLNLQIHSDIGACQSRKASFTVDFKYYSYYLCSYTMLVMMYPWKEGVSDQGGKIEEPQMAIR